MYKIVIIVNGTELQTSVKKSKFYVLKSNALWIVCILFLIIIGRLLVVTAEIHMSTSYEARGCQLVKFRMKIENIFLIFSTIFNKLWVFV